MQQFDMADSRFGQIRICARARDAKTFFEIAKQHSARKVVLILINLKRMNCSYNEGTAAVSGRCPPPTWPLHTQAVPRPVRSF